jgi:site-specific recombinase XerD
MDPNDSRRGSGRTSRLGDRARAAMRLRRFSPRTEDAYLGWMRRFYEFHGRRDPAALDASHVTAFLNALATERAVSASTQNQALGALLFLYREVLGRDLPWLDDLVRAKTPARLPVVLTRAEVRHVLQHMEGVSIPARREPAILAG